MESTQYYSFSTYVGPIFAQRKPNGNLYLLVELRKNNSLIADEYTSNNHPVNTLSGAVQNLTWKSVLCKLDCSQAYHYNTVCRWRTNDQWKCLHSFVLAGIKPTKTCTRLRQICIYVFNFQTWVLGASCHNWPMHSLRGRCWCCSQKSYGCFTEHSGSPQVRSPNRIETDIGKCLFGVKQIEFLRRTISRESFSKQARKKKVSQQTQFPESKKTL